MAVSSVRVTEGSGPYLHTWQRSISSVNREDQYVQLGEPALPTFVVPYAASAATADSHILQIMAGSSLNVRILAIEMRQVAAASSATTCGILFPRLTTAGTGGTALTPRALDSADSPGATAMALPSSKGTEGNNLYYGAITLTATTGTGVLTWYASDRGKPIIIPAGTTNGLAIKVLTGAASATIAYTVTFTETAWL